MVGKALLIAYHYPPVSISSGVQRTLAFSQYLGSYDWEPIVLTVHPRAYQAISDDQLKDIPGNLVVERAFALDTGRHLAIGGRYLGLMAIPDRWVTWWIGGVISGLRLIRRHRPNVIWSTYPIVTAHLIGLTLSKLTGIPLVADFRDSMVDDSYPTQKRMRYVHGTVERLVLRACRFAVFTTPGAVRLYHDRYPDIPVERFRLIPNGYNEEIFLEVESRLGPAAEDIACLDGEPIVLVHSGVIYPEERNPAPFFQAIAELKQERRVTHQSLRIVLRATGHDSIYTDLINQLIIGDIVQLLPGVGYRDSLKEMMRSNGLMIFQAATCNHQIPAKLYEYLRAGKPIFALTDKAGDTAGLLHEAGIDTLAPLDDVVEIKSALVRFLDMLETGEAPIPKKGITGRYSRKQLTRELADIFAEAIT